MSCPKHVEMLDLPVMNPFMFSGQPYTEEGRDLYDYDATSDDTIDTVVKQTSSDNVGVDMANPYPTNASLVSPPSVSNPAKRTPPSSLPGPPNLTAPSGHAAPTLPQVQDDIDGALFQLDENHAAHLIAGETGGGLGEIIQ